MDDKDFAGILLDFMGTIQTVDGSLESAEEVLAGLRSSCQEHLLALGVVALDREVERPVCLGCSFDFDDAEIEVTDGCKCRNCGRTIRIVDNG